MKNYFSKNIALNICIAIFVTSLVTLNNKISEGFRVKGAAPDGGTIAKAAPIKSRVTIEIPRKSVPRDQSSIAGRPILDLRPGGTEKALIKRGTRQPIEIDPVLDPPDPVDPGGGGGEDPEEPEEPPLLTQVQPK